MGAYLYKFLNGNFLKKIKNSISSFAYVFFFIHYTHDIHKELKSKELIQYTN